MRRRKRRPAAGGRKAEPPPVSYQQGDNTMKRRNFLHLAAGSALAAAQPLAFSQAAQPTKVRVGYLHTLAVDGQMWLADSMGLWKKEGLDMEFIKFQTGLELFQAMS